MDARVPSHAARLTDLPTELLGLICRQLSLKDRVALSITCRTLLHSLASSEDAWGTLDFSDMSKELPSILPWLAQRRQSLRRLCLDFQIVVDLHIAANLAACLEASSLVQLDLSFLFLHGEECSVVLQQLSRCTTLTSLTLDTCELCCLPDALETLPALAELALRFNELGGASWEQLRRLTALTRLDISNCELGALPAQLAVLPCLAVLNLRGNNGLWAAEEDAWAPLALCSSLTSLDLGDIPFERLPEALAALVPHLLDLNLRLDNDEVPCIVNEASLGPLYKLTGLTRLNLSRCFSLLWHLPTMPEELSCLVALQDLDLSCSQFMEEGLAANPLRHVTALTRLSLCGCELEDLPVELSCLVALRDLDLSWNTFMGEGLAMHPLCHLTALTRLSLGSCNLKHLPEETSHLKALKDLEFGSCIEGLQDISWQRIRRLTTLTRLDLANCNLERLPPDLAELQSLAELKLSLNKLLGESAADGAAKWAALEQLTALTKLNASSCDLGAVPTAFGTLHRLQVLILSNNYSLGRSGVEALRTLTRMTSLQHLGLYQCNLPLDVVDAIPFPLHRLEGWAERIKGLSQKEIDKLVLELGGYSGF